MSDKNKKGHDRIAAKVAGHAKGSARAVELDGDVPDDDVDIDDEADGADGEADEMDAVGDDPTLVSTEELSEEEERTANVEDDEGEGDDSVPTIRRRMMADADADADEDDVGDDEADAEEAEATDADDFDESSDDLRPGLSAFGRSSFEEDDGTPADAEEDDVPKKKRRVTRRKATPAKAAATDYRSWEEEVEGVDERKAKAYVLTETYRLEEIIAHSKFGLGKVVEVLNPQKITVLFKDGPKMMLQGRR